MLASIVESGELSCLKSLEATLSFTPGFSPVTESREQSKTVFNGFLAAGEVTPSGSITHGLSGKQTVKNGSRILLLPSPG
jgi:hypothetical protein